MPEAGGIDFEGVVPEGHSSLLDMISTLRLYLRDYPQLNRLTSSEDHNDRLLAWAILDAIDDFNSTAPFTRFGVNNFPSKSLLLRGATVSALESLMFLMVRNQLNYNDGGISVGVSDKTPLVKAVIDMLRSVYEEKKLKMKIAMNIEEAWGDGVHSEYLWTNAFYGSW